MSSAAIDAGLDQSIDALIDQHIREQPGANDRVIEHAQTPPVEAQQQGSTPGNPAPSPAPEIHREVFDPKRHVTTKEGKPMLTRDGKFRLRPGRPRNPAPAPHPQTATRIEPGAQAGQEAPPQLGADVYAAAGAETALMIVLVCTVALGPEMNPENGELDAIGQAWAEYYKKIGGVPQMPAWLAPTLATGMYVIPRLGRPGVQARIQKIRDFIRGKPSQTAPGAAPQEHPEIVAGPGRPPEASNTGQPQPC